MKIAPARGHSSATLYEAAVSEWRKRARGGTPMPEVAVDPAIRAWPGATVAARAFTIRGTGGDNLALHRAVLCASPGDVLVADLGGSQHGHWGEILSVAAQQRGIVGLVIDGGVRDRDQMRAIGFPVFSRNDSVRGTVKSDRGELGGTIDFAGVRVATGDLVVGDADGVIVIPSKRVNAVLDEADRRVAHEKDVLTALRSGKTTIELYDLDGAALPPSTRR